MLDDLGLVEAVDGLGEGIVIGASIKRADTQRAIRPPAPNGKEVFPAQRLFQQPVLQSSLNGDKGPAVQFIFRR